MFFKYNPMISRLAPSSQLSAYSPQGLMPYAGDSAPIVFSSKTVKAVGAGESLAQVGSSAARSMASASAAAPAPGLVGLVPNTPGYKKIMDLQKELCKDDGKLVWMKRGARDSIPYYGSMALMVLGLSYGFYTIYQMSVKKK